MVRRLFAALPIALSAATGCNAHDGIASEAGISVEASISDATIGSAEAATITYTLRNLSPIPRLVPVGCDIGRLRIDDDLGVNAFPRNESFACLAVYVPPETLASGGTVTRRFIVTGSAGRGSLVRLPTGRYAAAAEFTILGPQRGRSHIVRGEGPSFEVTP